MFHFDRLTARRVTGQPIDFIGLVPLFHLFGFHSDIRQKMWVEGRGSQGDERFSGTPNKWNKWNSRTSEKIQGVNPFQTVRDCSTFVALCAARDGVRR